MAKVTIQTWNLMIEDPSGQKRSVQLEFDGQGSDAGLRPTKFEVGRQPGVHIPLRDARAPLHAATLELMWTPQGAISFWIRVASDTPSLRVGDLEIRDSILPPDRKSVV